jgi:hypothetical protein
MFIALTISSVSAAFAGAAIAFGRNLYAEGLSVTKPQEILLPAFIADLARQSLDERPCSDVAKQFLVQSLTTKETSCPRSQGVKKIYPPFPSKPLEVSLAQSSAG